MKKIISLTAIILLAFHIASAQFTKAELQAAGLTCSMCSRAVDKQLRTLDFIDSVGIDLRHTTFILFFKKDKIVDFGEIKNKVEDAGFSVASLSVTYKFDNLKIQSDYHFVYQHYLYLFLNVNPQTLNGTVAFRIVNKGYLNNKEYKKYETEIAAHKSAEDGKASEIKRVYHVIL